MWWGGLDPAGGDFSSFPEITWPDEVTHFSSGEVVIAVLCGLFEKQEYAGSGEAVGYDRSRSKRITAHRSLQRYNNTPLRAELCCSCIASEKAAGPVSLQLWS